MRLSGIMPQVLELPEPSLSTQIGILPSKDRKSFSCGNSNDLRPRPDTRRSAQGPTDKSLGLDFDSMTDRELLLAAASNAFHNGRALRQNQDHGDRARARRQSHSHKAL